jgi:hypothetical protein
MSVSLETITVEKAEISKLLSSSAHTDNEQKELNIKLGELLKEHGRHLIEYLEVSGTTDADKIGEFFVNWGEYLIRITKGNTKFTPFRPDVTNPAKYVSMEYLTCRDEWRELYNILEF